MQRSIWGYGDGVDGAPKRHRCAMMVVGETTIRWVAVTLYYIPFFRPIFGGGAHRGQNDIITPNRDLITCQRNPKGRRREDKQAMRGRDGPAHSTRRKTFDLLHSRSPWPARGCRDCDWKRHGNGPPTATKSKLGRLAGRRGGAHPVKRGAATGRFQFAPWRFRCARSFHTCFRPWLFFRQARSWLRNRAAIRRSMWR